MSAPVRAAGSLLVVQRRFAAAVMRPLTGVSDMQPQWTDGRDMHTVAAEFIRPNNRLTSFERLELYNRQYWYRLIDCLIDDFPGLGAVLGNDQFVELIEAYLVAHPSTCGQLRYLGEHLPEFIENRSDLIPRHHQICFDLARFEWAQIVAFDEGNRTPLSVDDLLGQDPNKLRLSLQPSITLMETNWELTDFLQAVKKGSLRADASNASSAPEHAQRRSKIPRRKHVRLCIHRHLNSVYIKHLTPTAYTILTAIDSGKTLAKALDSAFTAETFTPRAAAKVQSDFRLWSEFGWFCKRPPMRQMTRRRQATDQNSR
jgi:hypothetical protein